MKLALKIISIILILLVLLISDLTLVKNSVQALALSRVTVYEKMYCDKVLIYSGKEIGAYFVVHNKDGIEYPAYCLDPDLDGVGEVEQYDLTVNEKIQEVGLWRVLINGYPYKTPEQLGVANEKEAYLATKQALYCYIKNRNPDKYLSNGSSAGNRTLNALKQIVNNAKDSTEVPPLNNTQIIANQTEWQQDSIEKKYVSKTYEVHSTTTIKDYTISISGNNILEGIKVTDINNTERKTFANNEKFKILIPIYNLNNNGNFNINLDTEALTKPVLYGASPSKDLQNYALVVHEFEETNNVYSESYGENKTKIKILKQDKTTKQPLQGVEFELLDENKELIYTNLVTDVNGEILIRNLLPGKYYIREIKALNGYINYDELIEIDIELNETFTITINNSREKKIEFSSKKTDLEVGVIRKLPVTGM